MNKLLRSLATVLVVFGFHGCSTSSGGPSTAGGLPTDLASSSGTLTLQTKGTVAPAVAGIPSTPGSSSAYRIGPFDLLKIEVFQADELSSEERVSEDGFVAMPLIGNVQVSGLTPREAEQAIAERLKKNYLQNPQVDVFVAEYASQKVTVTGHVKQPGVFPLTGQTTLMQAIALAGGPDEIADKDEIVVFRNQPGSGVKAYVVDLSAIEEGKIADPVVAAGDRVVVPKSGMAVFSEGIGKVVTGIAIRLPWAM